jgi:hypothetical protein
VDNCGRSTNFSSGRSTVVPIRGGPSALPLTAHVAPSAPPPPPPVPAAAAIAAAEAALGSGESGVFRRCPLAAAGWCISTPPPPPPARLRGRSNLCGFACCVLGGGWAWYTVRYIGHLVRRRRSRCWRAVLPAVNTVRPAHSLPGSAVSSPMSFVTVGDLYFAICCWRCFVHARQELPITQSFVEWKGGSDAAEVL